MVLHLYLLRHGETTHSQTGGYCGDLDPDLTAEGMLMAEAFATAYQQFPWQAVYTSPMRRTLATAAPLCRAIAQEPIRREGLRELRYGAWEGQTQAHVREHYADDYQKWLTEPAWNPPTDGETAVQIANRAMAVIAEIEATYTDGSVLVISHKATIRIMLCSLLGIDLGRYRDRLDLPTCALSVLRFEKYGPMLQRLGDRSHLPPELAQRLGT
ncbi:MAG: histidine phosphatase family protein [Oscillatoriales cyanobacterium SM2_2_1]|nr:histidine phosphatase family protein [Oscillatoriales cyanobacterium SM2_2_1]